MSSNRPTAEKGAKRTDIWKINHNLLIADENFNIRKDYGDIDSLALSIAENGVKVPLSGYRKGDYFYVTDGFRRTRAIKYAIDLGFEINDIPFVVEPLKYTDTDRIFDMIIKNDGKQLTSLEQGEGFKRLLETGLSQSEISKRIGKSTAYICDMLTVANMPKEVKQYINSGVITASLVSDVLKQVDKDENKLIQVIQDTKEKLKDKGIEKITNKYIKEHDLLKPKNDVEETKQTLYLEVTDKNNNIVYSGNNLNKMNDYNSDYQIILKNNLGIHLGNLKLFS